MKSLLDEESLKQVVINAKKELPELTIEILIISIKSKKILKR
jgi:hypothetical protein